MAAMVISQSVTLVYLVPITPHLFVVALFLPDNLMPSYVIGGLLSLLPIVILGAMVNLGEPNLYSPLTVVSFFLRTACDIVDAPIVARGRSTLLTAPSWMVSKWDTH